MVATTDLVILHHQLQIQPIQEQQQITQQPQQIQIHLLIIMDIKFLILNFNLKKALK